MSESQRIAGLLSMTPIIVAVVAILITAILMKKDNREGVSGVPAQNAIQMQIIDYRGSRITLFEEEPGFWTAEIFNGERFFYSGGRFPRSVAISLATSWIDKAEEIITGLQ